MTPEEREELVAAVAAAVSEAVTAALTRLGYIAQADGDGAHEEQRPN